MRYWDASALVPLLVQEKQSTTVRTWLEKDPHITTWALSRVEIQSSIERKRRENVISEVERKTLLSSVRTLANAWDEVSDILIVRTLAAQVLGRHALRAADALQLASALVISDNDPNSVTMVCLDKRLAEAADREGLQVLSI